MCILTALGALPLPDFLNAANIVMLFLLTVFVVAVWLGRGPSILATFLSVALFDFFFVLPHLSFAYSIDDSGNRVPGTAVFLTQNLHNVPHGMLHSLKHYKVLHERMVVVFVNILDTPRLTEEKRVVVTRLKNQFWQVRVSFGFLEQPTLPSALEECAADGLVFDPMDTSYFLGRETLVPKLKSEMCFWREKVFIGMFRNAGSAVSFFGLPPNRVVELGTQVVL
jgi:KUP system potassium uptake protein